MILAIDIGNTHTIAGCLDNSTIYFVERIATDYQKTAAEYAVILKSIIELNHIELSRIEGIIISSVVPPVSKNIENAVTKLSPIKPFIVGPGLKTGLNIKTDNPAQLGSDLVVGAVAAIDQYPCPLIVFDLGTATTISVIDKNKVFLGVVIYPGVHVAFESLANKTAQLPDIRLEKPDKVIGTTTVACMQSGAIYGNASMIDGMIERIEEELGMTTTVVATGGLASSIATACKKQIIVDDELLLKGLLILYNKNKK